jgi:xenotropic and polytropic retrovirus receptor 1
VAPLYYILCALAVLPYYWRFMQCLRRYKDTGDAFPHLVNGLKYLSSIAAIVISFVFPFKGEYWYITVSVYFYSTLYSFIWDLKMDWGLLRSRKRTRWGLRNKIMYPPHYYYFAIFTNLILRFSWVLSTSLIDEKEIFGDFEGIYFALSFFEAYRRA